MSRKSQLFEDLHTVLASLSIEQLKFVRARLEHSSDGKAAHSIDVKPNTVYSWKRQFPIDDAIKMSVQAAIYKAMEDLTRISDKAVSVLVASLDSTSEKDRIRAARAVLRETRHLIVNGGGWTTTRWAVLRRDGFRCRYCGADASDGVKLEVDHVVPRALGGSDEMGNLITACGKCNLGKRDMLPTDRIFELARRKK